MKLARVLEAPARTILAVALGVRLLFIVGFGIPGPVTEDMVEWGWGREQAAVARAVIRGEGFADPFAQGTGPTAWCGAVYPMLLAGIIKCLGTTGQGVASCTALIDSIFSAGIVIGLSQLGAGLGRARLGRISAWAWAFHPGAIYFPLIYVWDTVILAFGITFLLARLAHAGRRPTRGQTLRIGAGLGLLTLVNASALALVPVVLVFWTPGRESSRSMGVWATFAAGVIVVLGPWLVRNKVLLGTFLPKANLGVELMVGNNDEADGGFRPHLHPRHNLDELEAYRQLGEVAYDKRCREIFLDWLRRNPADFAQLTAVRVGTFWLGFNPFAPVPLRSGESKARDWQGWVKWGSYFLGGALALAGLVTYSDRRGGRLLLGGSLACFPVVYYAVHVMDRYRFPIEPLLVYLSVASVLALLSKLGFGQLETTSAGTSS